MSCPKQLAFRTCYRDLDPWRIRLSKRSLRSRQAVFDALCRHGRLIPTVPDEIHLLRQSRARRQLGRWRVDLPHRSLAPTQYFANPG